MLPPGVSPDRDTTSARAAPHAAHPAANPRHPGRDANNPASPAITARCRRGSRHRCAILAHWRSSARKYRSEEHTSELQSLMRISYAVFCLKKKKKKKTIHYLDITLKLKNNKSKVQES